MANQIVVGLLLLASIGVMITYGGTDDFYQAAPPPEREFHDIPELADYSLDDGEIVTLTNDYIWLIHGVDLNIFPGGKLTIEEGTTVLMYDDGCSPRGIKLWGGDAVKYPELVVEPDVEFRAKDYDSSGEVEFDEFGAGIYANSLTAPAFPKITIEGAEIQQQVQPIVSVLEVDWTITDSTFFNNGPINIVNVDGLIVGGTFFFGNNYVEGSNYDPLTEESCIDFQFSYLDPDRVQLWGNEITDCEIGVTAWFEWAAPFTDTLNFALNKMINNDYDFQFYGEAPGPTHVILDLHSVIGSTIDGVLIDEELGNYWEKNTISAGDDADRNGVDDDPFVQNGMNGPDREWTGTDPAPFTNPCLCQVPGIYYEVLSGYQGPITTPTVTVQVNDPLTFFPHLQEGYKADLTGNNPTTPTLVEWDFDNDGTPEISKTSGFTSQAEHTYTTSGTFFCVARVHDDQGQVSDDDEASGTLGSPKREMHILDGPTAIISGIEEIEYHQLQEFTLDGSDSWSPNDDDGDPNDNNITSYSWTVSIGTTTVASGTSPTLVWTPTEYTTYTVFLQVSDEVGYIDFLSLAPVFVDDPPVAVAASNNDPTPPPTPDENKSYEPNEKIYFFDLSTDIQNNIVSSSWRIQTENGTNITRSGNLVNYTWTKAGEYLVVLTVEDESANTDMATLNISIKEVVDREVERRGATEYFLGPVILGIILAIIAMVVAYRYDRKTFEWPSMNIIAVGVVIIAIVLLFDQFVSEISFLLSFL
jgi:hypothetical protein